MKEFFDISLIPCLRKIFDKENGTIKVLCIYQICVMRSTIQKGFTIAAEKFAANNSISLYYRATGV